MMNPAMMVYFDELQAAEIQDILLSFHTFWKRGRYSDVTITVGNQSFPCHKVILAASVPYFERMFESGMRESRSNVITLKTEPLQPDTFKSILEYVYSHSISVNEDSVQDILEASQYLQMNVLVEMCCRFMKEWTTEDNCIALWQLAKRLAIPDLAEHAYMWILSEFETIKSSQEFLALDRESLIECIKSDDLDVNSEDDVFRGVLDWVNHSPQERRPCLREIVQHLRLTELKIEDLQEEITRNTYLDNYLARQMRHILNDVSRGHIQPHSQEARFWNRRLMDFH